MFSDTATVIATQTAQQPTFQMDAAGTITGQTKQMNVTLQLKSSGTQFVITVPATDASKYIYDAELPVSIG